MLVSEAAAILKNTICPFCQNGIKFGNVSPFSNFDDIELKHHCNTKECIAFFDELHKTFKSYESGQIDETEFRQWLDNFKRNEKE